jgi:hypothetical protein
MQTLIQLRSVADLPLILDISIHGKEEREHGVDHFRVKEKSTPINVVETLEEEFKT